MSDERLKQLYQTLTKDFNGVEVKFISPNNYSIAYGNKEIELFFQNGPIKDDIPNGITNESLLTILKHRINALNEKNPCMMNINCLHYLDKAEQALEERTRDRLIRSVEGSDKP